jgi:hypothetical protein
MKKVIAIIIALIILVGGIYYFNAQEDEEGLLLDQYVCNVDEVDYYVYNQLIYFKNKQSEDFILADFGSYQLKPTKDGWTLKFFSNKFDSTYTTLVGWIDARQHPMAGKVKCKSFEEFPAYFQYFIDNHRLLLEQINEDFKELE